MTMSCRVACSGPLFFVLVTAMDIKNKILNLAEPLVKAQGLEIWGLDLQEAAGNLVRLFVERPLDELLSRKNDLEGEPVSATIEQCEEISRQLGLALDVEDCFPGPWTLEVSTPGLERKFYTPAQLKPYVNDLVEVRLLEAVSQGEPGRKTYRGKLLDADSANFTIELQEPDSTGNFAAYGKPPLTIPWEKTRSVSRIHLFNKPARPGKKQGRGK